MDKEIPLGYFLCRAKRAYKNKLMIRYKEKNIDLSLDQFIILRQVSQKEEVTQQELADHLQKDKSIIMRQIYLLVEKEFITRTNDKKDKRKKKLTMTSKGSKTLELSIDIACRVSQDLLFDVSSDEQQVFRSVIKKIQKNGGFEEDACCN